MAFNWKTFKTRTLTAVIFVVVMLAGLLINHWTFFILFSVIHFGCWWEYQKLIKLIDKGYSEISAFHRYGVMIAGWSIMLNFTKKTYSVFGFQLNQSGWWIILVFIFLLIVELLFKKNKEPKNIGHSFFGLLYISLSLGLMMDLYAKSNSIFSSGNTTDIHLSDWYYVLPAYFYPVVIIAAIWINDTMAYIMGSLIGRTQMSKISPKKTWEGTISGIILSATLIFLLSKYVFRFIKFGYLSYFLVAIAVIASIAGTFGDLLESKLKRMAGVKDSGHIMPGHGGFLDRFDSLLVAVPFVWLYVYLFMR